MFQLNDPTFAPQAVGNLIKASDYSRLVTAHELVATAQQRAQQIIDDAQREWQRQQAAGFQAGLMQAQEAMAEKAIDYHQRMQMHLQETRQQLVEIVMQVVTKVVGDLPATELVGHLIERALAELAGQHRVTLLVNPENLATLDQLRQKLRNLYGIDVLELESDSRVSIQSCVLCTPKQVIDASFEVQLQSLRQLLTRSFADEEGTEAT